MKANAKSQAQSFLAIFAAALFLVAIFSQSASSLKCPGGWEPCSSRPTVCCEVGCWATCVCANGDTFCANPGGGGCIEQCQGGGGGGGGGGCTPVTPCSNLECGSDSCGTGCTNQCTSDPFYNNVCTGNRCQYYPAALNASISSNNLCVNNSAASRTIIVSGRSSYCGNINATASWGDKQTFTGTNAFDYTFTFLIPQTEIARYIQTKEPATILVAGDRNNAKSTRDEPNYECSQMLTVSYTFDNFYYCPSYGENINSDFDHYDGTQYYVQRDSTNYYDWDECLSDDLLDTCISEPTNCLDKSLISYPINTTLDPDTDQEYEVCKSLNGIQGGWLDADSDSEICGLVNGRFNRTTTWFTCAKSSQCTYGKNDFFNAKTNGLCCGDDLGEISLETSLVDSSNNPFYMTGTFTSCCRTQDSCVDKEGICRQEGYSRCLDEGLKGRCTLGVWHVSNDTTCEKSCTTCNVNKAGASKDVIDITDLTAIQNNYGSNDSDYDINKDAIVDQADYDECLIYLNTPCSACTDGIFQPTEECNTNSGNVVFHDNLAPVFRCQTNQTILRDNSTCLPNCNSKYFGAQCLKGQCGASCGSDSDCSTNALNLDFKCNTETCQCEIVGCPVGSALCMDGTCSQNCSVTDSGTKGCLNQNGACDQGEGCACADCLNKRDSCVFGSVCGPNKLCSCPLGTALCLDGTCSFDCAQTDTGTHGCIIENTICEPGEGCSCSDCSGKQDSCILGGQCNYVTEQCESQCIKTQDVETITDDEKDNDCDGLVDEPEFWPGYGLYAWEAGCTYFMCIYGDDSITHNTTGTLSVSGIYKIYSLKQSGWESEDSLLANTEGKQVTFISKLYNDLDCIMYKSETNVKYDVTLDGSKNKSRVYLTQFRSHPFEIPFFFASPECSLTCNSPGACASPSLLFTYEGCSSDKCMLDCGGYWINASSAFDLLWPSSNLGDYCAACTQNTTCSIYTNKESCSFDPCKGSLTSNGCKWDDSTTKCTDNFEYCMPGTTLCKDGTCQKDCIDAKSNYSSCIGNPDGKCVVGEGCTCSDCLGKQDTCIAGAVCGKDKLCGCPLNTTLCNDKTCDTTCANHGRKTGCIGGVMNNRCEFGEGCACEDCKLKQDSCIEGLSCNIIEKVCLKFTSYSCKKGTALCGDLTCDDTCEENGGKLGCNGLHDGKCDDFEGCLCEDCYNKQDSCESGLTCNPDDKLCDDNLPVVFSCIDIDNDGYSNIEFTCQSGTDCNDGNSAIHPGALEACNNGIDDDCNRRIDDNCPNITAAYTLDINIDSLQKVRVFDTFNLKVKVTNKYNKAFENIKIILETPDKITEKSNSIIIPSIAPQETKEVLFELTIQDYKKESAILKLKAQVADAEISSRDIPVGIEIPEFAIFGMPESVQDDGNNICVDLYYVINRKEEGNYDIELDIKDPSAFFGKSVFVDYMSGIESTGDIQIEPMISNSYCLPSGKEYEIGGYLYKEGAFGIVGYVDETRNSLT